MDTDEEKKSAIGKYKNVGQGFSLAKK